MESPVILENSVNYCLPVNADETGFPFDDTDYDSNDRLQSTLHNIAQRHPEFADHLSFDTFPSWRRKRHGSGSSSEREEPRAHTSGQSFRNFDTADRRFPDHSFPSGFNRFPFTSQFDNLTDDLRTEEKPPEIPRTNEKRGRKVNPNLPQHLSNTVDLGQKTPVEENRGQRSMSAPPENRTHENNKFNTDSRDMGSMFARANKPQDPRAQNTPPKPKERVIPIHVEGRDEPLMPKNVNIETESQYNDANQAPEHMRQHPPCQQQNTTHFTRQPTPPTQQRFVPTQQVPTAPEQQQQEQKPAVNLNDPLEKIKSVKSDVLDLMEQVETFKGTRKDKHYIYLDEMLTRNLLKLDDVETEGKENIRLARREAIKCIQECINKLEAKAQLCESQNIPQVEQKTEEKTVTEIAPKVFKSEAKIEIKTPEITDDQSDKQIPPVLEQPQPNVTEKVSENVSGPQETETAATTEESKMEVSGETTETQQPAGFTEPSDVTNPSQPANETM